MKMLLKFDFGEGIKKYNKLNLIRKNVQKIKLLNSLKKVDVNKSKPQDSPKNLTYFTKSIAQSKKFSIPKSKMYLKA